MKPNLPLILALGALCACSPPPRRDHRERAAAPAPAPPPPEKHFTMICKNSQTGASVACGTPNAVMVGLKER
jgi:hypothetical protein